MSLLGGVKSHAGSAVSHGHSSRKCSNFFSGSRSSAVLFFFSFVTEEGFTLRHAHPVTRIFPEKSFRMRNIRLRPHSLPLAALASKGHQRCLHFNVLTSSVR